MEKSDGKPRNSLRAGISRTEITPRQGTPLAGACWLRPAGELCDRLFAKALVLAQDTKSAAIITADVCGFDPRMVHRLQKYCRSQLGIQFLLCNASHTHSGPDTYNEFSDYTDRRALARRRQYQAVFEKKLRLLLTRANQKLQLVSVSHGQGRAYFGINRRLKIGGEVLHMPNAKAYHDKTVSVFHFKRQSGKTLAVLFSYACHPTTRYKGEISADYPGPAQELIEREIGGIAMFAQGAAGEIRPNVVDPRSRPKKFRQGTQKDVDRYGGELGREVVRVLRHEMKPVDPRLQHARVTVRLPLESRWSNAHLRDYDGQPPTASEDLRHNLVEKIINGLKRNGFPKVWPMEFMLLRLSEDHAILATSHELCNSYVPLLQRMARGTKLTIWGYTNDLRAYVPTRRQRLEGGYEGEWSFFYYGMPCPFAPSVEQVVVQAARKLLRL